MTWASPGAGAGTSTTIPGSPRLVCGPVSPRPPPAMPTSAVWSSTAVKPPVQPGSLEGVAQVGEGVAGTAPPPAAGTMTSRRPCRPGVVDGDAQLLHRAPQRVNIDSHRVVLSSRLGGAARNNVAQP